jgi:catechol 2,3-dioxygenase-like lactoylglutathione lyase family enzyme
MQATRIDHVNLRYPPERLDEVIAFYVDALGFETDFEDPYAAVGDDPGLFPVHLGPDARIYVNPDEGYDSDQTNYRHVAVRVPAEPADLEALLNEEGIDVESTADRERDSVGAYSSYYVQDPIGYTVELMAVGE